MIIQWLRSLFKGRSKADIKVDLRCFMCNRYSCTGCPVIGLDFNGKYTNQRGFTLIEILAVLIILGVLAGIVVPKFVDMDNTAKQRGLLSAASELTSRETTTWANVMMQGYTDDTDVINLMDYDLGDEYTWVSRTPTGGQLDFMGETATLKRTLSTRTSAAVWQIVE